MKKRIIFEELVRFHHVGGCSRLEKLGFIFLREARKNYHWNVFGSTVLLESI